MGEGCSGKGSKDYILQNASVVFPASPTLNSHLLAILHGQKTRMEAGTEDGGREGAEKGDQTPSQLWFPQDKSLFWTELSRLSGLCIYRMHQLPSIPVVCIQPCCASQHTQGLSISVGFFQQVGFLSPLRK